MNQHGHKTKTSDAAQEKSEPSKLIIRGETDELGRKVIAVYGGKSLSVQIVRVVMIATMPWVFLDPGPFTDQETIDSYFQAMKFASGFVGDKTRIIEHFHSFWSSLQVSKASIDVEPTTTVDTPEYNPIDLPPPKPRIAFENGTLVVYFGLGRSLFYNAIEIGHRGDVPAHVVEFWVASTIGRPHALRSLKLDETAGYSKIAEAFSANIDTIWPKWNKATTDTKSKKRLNLNIA